MKLVCTTEEKNEELLRPSWKERLRPWDGSGNDRKESTGYSRAGTGGECRARDI